MKPMILQDHSPALAGALSKLGDSWDGLRAGVRDRHPLLLRALYAVK